MEQDLLDEQETNPTNKRPVFLTVLCILTWVGSALYFSLCMYQYIAYSSILNDLKKSFSGMEMGTVANPFKWELWLALAGAVCAVLCAAGSVVMFKRRRWGFVVYVIGQLTPLFLTACYALSVESVGFDTMVRTVMTSLIPIGFIIMYALNLKHLRW